MWLGCPEIPLLSKVIKASIDDDPVVVMKALFKVSVIFLEGHDAVMLSGKSGESRIRTSDEGVRIPSKEAEERSSERRVDPRPSASPSHTPSVATQYP